MNRGGFEAWEDGLMEPRGSGNHRFGMRPRGARGGAEGAGARGRSCIAAGAVGAGGEAAQLGGERERDHGVRAGSRSAEQARIKALEREVGDLRRASSSAISPHRNRGALPCPNRRSGHGSLTQIKSPPKIPVRFTPLPSAYSVSSRLLAWTLSSPRPVQ